MDSGVYFLNQKSMFLKPVTDSELIYHLAFIKNNFSPGIDGIMNQGVEQHLINILEPLNHITNPILSKCVVPT